MRKVFAFSFLTSALAVCSNFVSGIVGARVLGPEGRGIVAAILVLPGFASWVFGLGAMQSLSYFLAKDAAKDAGRDVAEHERDRGALVSTWLTLLIPVAVIATIAIAVGTHFTMGSQSTHARHLGLLWAPTVTLALYANVVNGTLLGLHRYRSYATAMFVQTLVVTLGYCSMALIGQLTVATALLCTLAGSLCSLGFGIVALNGAISLARPRFELVRRTVPFGLKASGTNLGQAINGRLDLLIMPAILSATAVGQYSVAANVAMLIMQVAAAISPVVMPAAVRTGPQAVYAGLKATFAVAGSLSIAGMLIAGPAIVLLYGHEFADSAAATRILIPGVVLFAASQILWSGLYAANRPGDALLAQVPGVFATVVGLVLFLDDYGLAGAAVVSTVSYSVVFLCSLIAYRRAVAVKPVVGLSDVEVAIP